MVRLFTFLLIVCFLALPVLSFAESFDDASDAYKARDFKKAYLLFKSLAENGEAKAQYRLGYMYYKGQGVTKDYKEAVRWYRKAAEQGNAKAQYRLGYMYYKGRGVTKNYKEAAKWYRKAAVQGHAEAQFNLGNAYLKGWGVMQDYKEAVKWYRKAAEQGHATAQTNIGYMYINGTGVAEDYKQAAKWFRKAAEQGDAKAQNNLGAMYRHGMGVPKDYVKAYRWLDLAVSQGNKDAKKHIGLVLKDMSSSEIKKAKELAHNWKPKDLADAVDAYKDRDFMKAYLLFKSLARKGVAKAQYRLGQMYGRGFVPGDKRGFLPPNKKEALRWYRKAGKQGYAKAQEDLGDVYYKGKGVPQDYKEALRWYRKAAEHGKIGAQYNLGLMYRDGQGVPQDHKQAAKWFLIAAKRHGPKSQFNLGVMYAKGLGVPQDYKEALRWYRKAADYGHVDAQFNLGVMYAKGRGVTQDYREAARWYLRAAEQGHTKAQMEIARVMPLVLKSEAKASPGIPEPPAKFQSAASESVKRDGMVLVKGGCFKMGDIFWDGVGSPAEKPVHRVCLDDFWLDKYEVTQSDYKKVKGDNPSWDRCPLCPVERVLWYEAIDYCSTIGDRLPTEAEWEYAAREGGKRVKYGTGQNDIDKTTACMDDASSSGRDVDLCLVGSYSPNSLGLYDMSGNVYEWVADWFDKNYYTSSPERNPKGPSSGKYRVYRGGGHSVYWGYQRASGRHRGLPFKRRSRVGFRCAR